MEEEQKKNNTEEESTLAALRELERLSDEEDDEIEISLKSVLGGDILRSRALRSQVLFMMFIVALTMMYTANRYSSQQDVLLIDSLRLQLQDAKYNVMTQSSELLNLTRQSNIEKRLKGTADSVLQTPVTPPYLIPTHEGQNATEVVDPSMLGEQEEEENPTV